jgi:hypothetical protein
MIREITPLEMHREVKVGSLLLLSGFIHTYPVVILARKVRRPQYVGKGIMKHALWMYHMRTVRSCPGAKQWDIVRGRHVWSCGNWDSDGFFWEKVVSLDGEDEIPRALLLMKV